MSKASILTTPGFKSWCSSEAFSLLNLSFLFLKMGTNKSVYFKGLLFLFLFFLKEGTGSCYVTQTGLEFIILLPGIIGVYPHTWTSLSLPTFVSPDLKERHEVSAFDLTTPKHLGKLCVEKKKTVLPVKPHLSWVSKRGRNYWTIGQL